MPRNNQGVYTLPAGNPVVPGTLIETTWANPTMSDIAAALTGSLPRDGSAGMTGPLILSTSNPTNPLEAASKAYVQSFMVYATGMPVGAAMPFLGNDPPPGFLICNGQAVSRTTYAELFAVISTIYGAGDGVSTFNVPDLRNQFIRGKADDRAVGSTQAGSFAAHTHPVQDPGHTHANSVSASQASHLHGITTDPHSHGVNDPGHSHNAVVGLNVSGSGIAGGSGVLIANQTEVSGTGISINGASNLGGYTDAQQPAVSVSISNASATTGETIGSTGGAETVPQNMALIYVVKAVNDTTQVGAVIGVSSSDSNMIAIDGTNPAIPELDIKSNVAFGIPKLDVGGKVGLNQLPFEMARNLGFYDASTGLTPSQAYPTNVYYSGDTYTISVGGTLLVYDPVTLTAASTAVVAGQNLQYITGSSANPTGWYYLLALPIATASSVAFTPEGTIAANNVQDAITELDTETVKKSGDTMTGRLEVVTNTTTSALFVNQTGTGNVARFEDSANPDAIPVVIDQNGLVIVGATGSQAIGGTAMQLQILGSGTNGLSMGRWNTTTNPPYLIMGKSRNTLGGTGVPVQNNDDIAALWFVADGGTGMTSGNRAAAIEVEVDSATVAPGQIPGRICLLTNPAGATNPQERLRINSSGAFGLGGANFGSSGQTLVSQGPSAVPIWANPQAGRTISANDANPGLLITQTGTGDCLRVNQTGTGDVARFEDSANPDATPIVINTDGKLVVGSGTALLGSSLVQTVSTGAGSLALGRYTSDNQAPLQWSVKGRGVPSAPESVQNADMLGQWACQGFDGVTNQTASIISTHVDGTPAAGDVPGRVAIFTRPVGGTAPIERLRIAASGLVSLLNSAGLLISRASVSATPVLATDGNVMSGFYTPTVTGVTNVTAVSGFTSQYMRVGNVVTVSGKFDLTPTAVGVATRVRMSLPIPSSFVSDHQAGGFCSDRGTVFGTIISDLTNGVAQIDVVPNHTTLRGYAFNFTYWIAGGA